MNKQDKVFVGLLAVFFGVVLMTAPLRASVVGRSPKHIATINYSTVISSITPFTVLQATNTLQDQPGALYELIASTGGLNDYLILYDTIPFNTGYLTLTPSAATGLPYQLGPRYYVSSSSFSTLMVFDPPIIFYHGLMAIESSAGDQWGIVYEEGRGLSGQ